MKITYKKESSDTETEDSRVLTNALVKTIDGTPFATVKRGENDYIIIFGKHMITDKSFYSQGAAKSWCNQTDWLPILNVIGIYVENKIEELNNNKK